MPRNPLPQPRGLIARLVPALKVAPVMGFLGSTLLAFNASQLASLALLPLSPRAFRAYNRWAANTWWGWCVSGAELFNGTRIIVSGDELPQQEDAIVILNHQSMADITYLMFLARSKERLGDMKWMAKKIIKYVPGVGWGMLFLDCLFLERDWASDKESIRRTFAKLRNNRIPLWFLSFPEGTRFTDEKLIPARQYAQSIGRPEPRHVLLPRTKGFVATVEGLRGHVSAIYDITIGYGPEGVPTMGQYIKGLSNRCYLHVRRFPMDEVPEGPEALADWLLHRFLVKDEILDHFYRTGCFPKDEKTSATQ